MDRFTIRNLELVQPNHPDGKSLAETIDRTGSPMGARTLRRWLLMPLTNIQAIEQRHDAVDTLFADDELRENVQNLFRGIGDL